ncbi:tolloid-like protein 2 [Acropora palmata]|uniref:tolloid-like protein 2 n=1 Tax=Acropora palmata TaxID=6131 RepID=UPI003DA17888
MYVIDKASVSGWKMSFKLFTLTVFFAIPLHWKLSRAEYLGCTPLMSNMSVRLTKERFSVDISSPTTYHSNQSVHCLWLITVPKGYRIKVHFSTFDLQNNTNCSNSAVELIEINGSVSTLKGRYCGSYLPDDVISTSNHLSVMYTAANRSTLQHPGFQASISLASAETCDPFHDPDANHNILLSGLSGRFDGRSSHQTSMKCRWIITVPSGYRIKLSFQSFYLGPMTQENCENTNHLMVRDSINQGDPGFGKWCGDVVPSPFYSVGTKMMISFLSNNGTFLKAFEARFDAISEGVCSDSNRIIQLNLKQNSTGRVSSPDYPLQYFQVTGCYWRFKAPKGYRIKLRFTTLSIEDNCKQEEKGTELIRVDDFFTTNFRSVTSFWGIFCGSVKPPVIYSTGNVLQVFFTSNYTNNNDVRSGKQTKTSNNIGFYATYELTPQAYTSRCRTDSNMDNLLTLESHTGSIVSPGYPHSYPIISCTWNIKVPNSYILEVNVEDFELDCSGGNKLIVGQNSFCGSNKPSAMLSSEKDLKIQMITREAKDNRGFRATFSMKEREVDVANIVPWIVIPIVGIAIAVTLFITWRRRTSGFERRSSIRASIINRMRTQSTNDTNDFKS